MDDIYRQTCIVDIYQAPLASPAGSGVALLHYTIGSPSIGEQSNFALAFESPDDFPQQHMEESHQENSDTDLGTYYLQATGFRGPRRHFPAQYGPPHEEIVVAICNP